EKGLVSTLETGAESSAHEGAVVPAHHVVGVPLGRIKGHEAWHQAILQGLHAGRGRRPALTGPGTAAPIESTPSRRRVPQERKRIEPHDWPPLANRSAIE